MMRLDKDGVPSIVQHAAFIPEDLTVVIRFFDGTLSSVPVEYLIPTSLLPSLSAVQLTPVQFDYCMKSAAKLYPKRRQFALSPSATITLRQMGDPSVRDIPIHRSDIDAFHGARNTLHVLRGTWRAR